MKKLLSVIAIILSITVLFSLTGCGNTDTTSKPSSNPSSSEKEYEAVDMHVACLKGPTGVGMAKLLEDAQNKKTANRYTFTVATAADEISGKIISGEINIASVPTNLAAKLYRECGDKGRVSAYCFDFIGDTLARLTENLRAEYENIPIIYAGGVMSNKRIGKRLAEFENTYFSSPELSSDNAAGVALLCQRKLKEQIG